jgi:hypothetical protein
VISVKEECAGPSLVAGVNVIPRFANSFSHEIFGDAHFRNSDPPVTWPLQETVASAPVLHQGLSGDESESIVTAPPASDKSEAKSALKIKSMLAKRYSAAQEPEALDYSVSTLDKARVKSEGASPISCEKTEARSGAYRIICNDLFEMAEAEMKDIEFKVPLSHDNSNPHKRMHKVKEVRISIVAFLDILSKFDFSGLVQLVVFGLQSS